MTDIERNYLIEYLKDKVHRDKDCTRARGLYILTKLEVLEHEMKPLDRSVEMSQFLLRAISHANDKTMSKLVGRAD